jgi:hypothetical protein
MNGLSQVNAATLTKLTDNRKRQTTINRHQCRTDIAAYIFGSQKKPAQYAV